jgi:hypothetical protein
MGLDGGEQQGKLPSSILGAHIVLLLSRNLAVMSTVPAPPNHILDDLTTASLHHDMSRRSDQARLVVLSRHLKYSQTSQDRAEHACLVF